MVEPTIQDVDSEKLSGRECARGNLCENPSIQADRIDTDGQERVLWKTGFMSCPGPICH